MESFGFGIFFTLMGAVIIWTIIATSYQIGKLDIKTEFRTCVIEQQITIEKCTEWLDLLPKKETK